MTTKQTESYLTVPHSLSSHLAAGDIVPPIVPTSTTILHHSEKSTGLTSHAFPVTASISGLTQIDTTERPQVTDNGQQTNASNNVTKDTISEYLNHWFTFSRYICLTKFYYNKQHAQ